MNGHPFGAESVFWGRFALVFFLSFWCAAPDACLTSYVVPVTSVSEEIWGSSCLTTSVVRRKISKMHYFCHSINSIQYLNMSDQKPSIFREIFKEYIQKIIAIFLGISISFWFEEWRSDRNDRVTERKILLNLKENLAQDSLLQEGTAQMCKTMLSGINKLVKMDPNSNITDSVGYFIDMAASYTGCPINQTIYEEIKQTGRTSLIQDDTLKKAILMHYTSLMPYVKEWCETDKSHTMTQLIPEMSNYFPVVIDTFNMVSNQDKVKYLRTPKLRHLLLTNMLYKVEAMKALHLAAGNSKKLINRIDKVLSSSAY